MISHYIIPILISIVSTGNMIQAYQHTDKKVSCKELTYIIREKKNIIFISNEQNCHRKKPRYKIGSEPVHYYTYASGMGHFAEIDTVEFNKIVKKVFTEEDIDYYTRQRGFITIIYVVDSANGKILEVEFQLDSGGNDNHIRSIPLDKLAELETTLKREMICILSEELKEERQSYSLAVNRLFYSPDGK